MCALQLLGELAVLDLEDEEPEVLRAIIDTCRDLQDRAEGALTAWGPA